MTIGREHLRHRPLHAPRPNRSVLVEPPFDAVSDRVDANRSLRSKLDYDLSGRPLTKVIDEARRELLVMARQWTSSYRSIDWDSSDGSGPIFLAGHQPHLFHPGVWLKNFALSWLAERHDAVAVNLLIDSDTLTDETVHVPGGSIEHPQRDPLPMDRSTEGIPFEQRAILDRQMFDDFGRQASKQIAPLVSNPLLDTYWPMAIDRASSTGNLGYSLAQSRHQLEGQWGVKTLEVPQSYVCGTLSHTRFVAHILSHLERFQAAYNGLLAEYRRMHGTRNRFHPMPDLTTDNEYLEAPFWVWSNEDPRRRQLFVRRMGHEIELTDRHRREVRLPLSSDANADRAVERLMSLASDGLKIRGRALMTTLWARLVLGDLFVHGIGGAKYDQVTDALLLEFFGLSPPDFLILSATLHLPISHRATSESDLRTVRSRLRQLTWHPERSLEGTRRFDSNDARTLSELTDSKRAWIATEPTAENRHIRWRELRRINEAFAPFLIDERTQLESEHARIVSALRAEAILTDRGYAFCLFPETTLREFFDQTLP